MKHTKGPWVATKNRYPFLLLTNRIQKVLLKALFKSGYSVNQLIEAKEITCPEGHTVHGTWKITTGRLEGFCLNISKQGERAIAKAKGESK